MEHFPAPVQNNMQPVQEATDFVGLILAGDVVEIAPVSS
jgi:hypothetical protein